jgi:lysyl-tRNA synthetase class 2
VAAAFLMLVILIVYHKEFYAESDPTTRLKPLYIFLFAFFVMFLAGLLTLLNRHKEAFLGSPSLWQLTQTVLLGFIGISGPVTFATDRLRDIVNSTLAILGFFTLLVPVLYFFRRAVAIPKETPEEREIIKSLIALDADQDSLGYFATRHDKSVVWARNKKAGIAYRVQNGVMLASGDPFGEFSLWPEAIEEFLSIARAHAWTPAVMGASDRGGEVWVEKAEMLAIDIGDEAIIHVKDFTLEGKPMGNVRNMISKVSRKGYSASTYRWCDVPIETQSELKKLTKQWRYGADERGFSMSMDRFGEETDSQTVVTIARCEGKIMGLLYFVPWSTHSLSLDRMQRDKSADAGVNELMIATSVEYARSHDMKYVSLNFAAFRSLFERADKISAGPMVRTLRNIIRLFSNYFQVESLFRFNAKFYPEWQTRYVIYPKARDLPAVAWAAIQAEQFVKGFGKRSTRV